MSTAPADEPMQADPVEANSTRADSTQVDLAGADSTRVDLAGADSTRVDPAEADSARADDAADAMKDRLSKDVASWREGRADGSSRDATELSVAVARSTVPPTTARMKRTKPVTPETKPVTTGKKPFGMSYDGTSRQDYIKLMIARGAR
jgi:hypothetical protein